MSRVEAAPKVYVVSLARMPERRKAIAEQLARHGVDFTIVDAVDARQADPQWLREQVDEAAILRNAGRALSPPEIGCALSHRLIYREIVEKGECGALVLEDDVTLPPQFSEALAYFREAGPALADRWAVYQLGWSWVTVLILRLRTATRVGPRVRFAERIRWLSPEVWGTFGYYITRRAASEILVSPKAETFADHWSLWERRAQGTIYISSPQTVVHPPISQGSEIQDARSELVDATKGIDVWWRRLYDRQKGRAIGWSMKLIRPLAQRIL